MNNLLIDIGNGSVKAAFVTGLKIGEIFTHKGDASLEFILSLLKGKKPDYITISNVRKLSPLFFEEVGKRCRRLIVIGENVDIPLENGYNTPERLGPDRLMAAFAASRLFPDRNCMIFDFGTALTIDFVTSGKRFSGGNISPGLESRFRALHDYTQRLPLLEKTEYITGMGRDTEEAIRNGVILGLIFEVESYISGHPGHIVIFTGGDANYFAVRLKNSIFVVLNLVLIGLAHTTNDYVKKEQNRISDIAGGGFIPQRSGGCSE